MIFQICRSSMIGRKLAGQMIHRRCTGVKQYLLLKQQAYILIFHTQSMLCREKEGCGQEPEWTALKKFHHFSLGFGMFFVNSNLDDVRNKWWPSDTSRLSVRAVSLCRTHSCRVSVSVKVRCNWITFQGSIWSKCCWIWYSTKGFQCWSLFHLSSLSVAVLLLLYIRVQTIEFGNYLIILLICFSHSSFCLRLADFVQACVESKPKELWFVFKAFFQRLL